LELNASDDRGIDTVREKIKSFAAQFINLPEKRHKIIILDEVDSMTQSAQQALRVIMSDFSNTTRFALACNDSTKIIEPLQSRCTILRYGKIKPEEMEERLNVVISLENISADKDGINALVETAEGDMRYALNNMQSTIVGFGSVTRDNVYRIVDVPKPEIVNKIIEFLFNGNLKNAISNVNELSEEGYNTYDIVSTISKVIQNNNDINEDIRLDILMEVSKTKMKILDGVNSILQIYGLLANILKIVN
jgi:replication factor C subunit 2/4